MHAVNVVQERPDFRVFIDLLYGFEHNVDTEGNAYPVNSRVWTQLYIKDRESSDPPVEIRAATNSTSFVVSSESTTLEELSALYLFDYCGRSLLCNGTPLENAAIAQLRAKYSADLSRASNSIWHASTDVIPYPNLAAR